MIEGFKKKLATGSIRKGAGEPSKNVEQPSYKTLIHIQTPKISKKVWLLSK